MPQQNEPPRPHGDPLEHEIVDNNQAQRQSDALREEMPRGNEGAKDQADRAERRKAYDGDAVVTKID